MIHGLSDKRRMPRAGRIKLGVLVQKGGKSYPQSVDYFVAPPAVQTVFGDKPRALDIMFPVDDPEQIFPQNLSAYTKTGGLFCRGDKRRALRWQGQELIERACPCELLEQGKCKPMATINFLLVDVPGVGVWQLTTSNKASIVSLNSGLEQFAAMFGGLRGIPFRLLLEPQKVQRWDEQAKRHVLTEIHVLRLDSERTLREIIEWRARLGKPVEALMPAVEADPEEPVALPPHEDGNGGDGPPDLPGGHAAPRQEGPASTVGATASGRPVTQDGEVLPAPGATPEPVAGARLDAEARQEAADEWAALRRRATDLDIDGQTWEAYLEDLYGPQRSFLDMPQVEEALTAAERTPQTRAAFKAAVLARARKARQGGGA